jgi:hypothetical protein
MTFNRISAGTLLAAAGLLAITAAPAPVHAEYINGIDVSHFQGTVDWTAAKDSGVIDRQRECHAHGFYWHEITLQE